MIRKRLWMIAAVGAAMMGIGCGTATAPAATETQMVEATWESLSSYECPEWFRDAKFGIYAHWGPYSAAEGSRNTDWYSRNMYKPGHPNNTFHVKTYGPVLEFGYKDLIPSFTAEKFNAEEWVDLYVESGARFAGPVGEHADGFAMWDSKVNPWNAVKMGPKRDVVGEMARAVRARGLKLVVSMHHHWLWGWYPTWDENTDAADPANASLYGPKYPATAQGRDVNGRFENMYADPLPSADFQATWLEKVKEVVTQYEPDLLWFDNRMQLLSEQTRREMLAFYYNHARNAGKEVVLTYKSPDVELGTATLDLERSRMPSTYPEPWLTDTSVSASSWAYANDLQYYSADRLVDDLVDIVSKNGSLLLNVAPHPDGTIPVEQQKRLRAMGRWLKVNGEAIYGTRPWLIFGEGPTKTPVGHLSDRGFDGFSAGDIRFTRQVDTLYAIALGWPEDEGTLTIRALGSAKYSDQITAVNLLGHTGELEFERTTEGLTIQLPTEPVGEFAFVFRINR